MMKKKVLLGILLCSFLLLAGCGETKKEEKKKEEPKMDYLVLVNKQNKLPDYWEKVVKLEEAKDAWGDKVLVEKQALKKYYELEKTLEKEEKKKEEPKMDYLVLVNKQNKLPDYWEKVVKLEEAKDAWGDKVLVEKQALKKYYELEKALEKEKVDIELDSIYRSVKEQQNLWDEWSKDPEKGPDYVKKYVAVPGYSEHHTGLAIDICIKKNGKIIADNEKMIAEKEIFAKIHKKLADYGFILRYPKGRDGVTGYSYEPWHFRYVGEKVAKEIAKKDITFEEYLGKAKLSYVPEEGKIATLCTNSEKLDGVKVSTETTFNYDENQLAMNMMVKTSYVYEDKDEYEYNKKDMKKSLLENYDPDLVQDYLFNDKKQKIDTLFVYKELEIPKKEKKDYYAKEIVKFAEEKGNRCTISGATRKDLGLK